jgi:putative selenium metabolism hydrolase
VTREALAKDITRRAEALSAETAGFLSNIIRIKSLSGGEGEVVRRIADEMRAVGLGDVTIDAFGNVRGGIGRRGPLVAADAHVDTVDVGNAANWTTDPFSGEVRDGFVWGRGTSDQKAGMAAIVYAGKVLADLGMDLPFRFLGVGSVQEEDCDGLCWQYLVREEGLRPDCVIITEPTVCNVYRGHRGRMEIAVSVAGVSAHGSAPERGVNAIYRMARIVGELEALNERLRPHPFLGKGTLAVSDIRSTSPSLCAVADSCRVHVDRRLTAGETRESAVAEIEALPSVREHGAKVDVLRYEEPTHTGMKYPTDKHYPTWLLDEGHPALAAATRAYSALFGEPCVPGRWTFSTNGIATMGMHGIPTLGFGPGDERYAHAPDERCPVEHLARAVAFYALFGFELAGES